MKSHKKVLLDPLEVERLEQIRTLRKMSHDEALDWAGRDEDRLHQVASARGYGRGWVYQCLLEFRGFA